MCLSTDYSYIAMSARVDGGEEEEVVSALADSGASDHIHDARLNSCLKNARPSPAVYETAVYDHLQGHLC